MKQKPGHDISRAFTGWMAVIVGIVASIAILLAAFLISLPFARNSSEMAAWVQGTGTIMAIVAGFIGVLYQVAEQQRARDAEIAATGRAAYSMAANAFKLVTERLNSALQPRKSTNLYSLRALRTTEMVNSMREFEAGSLPTTLIQPFTDLRACVFAINTRISEIYDAENALEEAEKEALTDRRVDELDSTVRVYKAAEFAFVRLGLFAVRDCQAVASCDEVPEPLKDVAAGVVVLDESIVLEAAAPG